MPEQPMPSPENTIETSEEFRRVFAEVMNYIMRKFDFYFGLEMNMSEAVYCREIAKNYLLEDFSHKENSAYTVGVEIFGRFLFNYYEIRDTEVDKVWRKDGLGASRDILIKLREERNLLP